ncbi:MAG TPA: hypothetical protein DEF05_13395 [Erwinia sp.]|nr:hypothetical protein [Erwinia sp.]
MPGQKCLKWLEQEGYIRGRVARVEAAHRNKYTLALPLLKRSPKPDQDVYCATFQPVELVLYA